jgi:hypothetical protein
MLPQLTALTAIATLAVGTTAIASTLTKVPSKDGKIIGHLEQCPISGDFCLS